MARAVVDIDVNDQAFKDFVDKFAAYKEGLAKLPGIWNEVNDAASEGGDIIGGATAEILSQNAALRAQAEAHDRIGQARATSARRNAPTLPTGPLFDVGGATRVRQESAPATPPGVGAPREGGAAGEGATLGLDTAALASGLALFEKMEAEKKKITAEDAKSDKLQTEADKKSAKAMADRKKASDGLVKDTQKITKGVADATLSLMKWATIGLGTGLLGGGGLLFGLDRMAQNIGDTRRTAQGLNISTGDLRAFGLTYQRLIDPQQFLGGVNEAMHNITSPGRIGLLSAGLSPGLIAGQDTAQVGGELLDRIRAIAKNTPDQLMGNTLQARHLDQFVDLQTFERLKTIKDEEYDQIKRQYVANQQAMKLQDQASKAWQDMAVTLHTAGNKIEILIAGKFAKLAPQIDGLSDAVVGVISSLLDGIKPADIDALGKGIKDIGAYLKSPKFAADLQDFETQVSELGAGLLQLTDAILDAARALGIIHDPKDDKPIAPGSHELQPKKYGFWDGLGNLINPFGANNPKYLPDVLGRPDPRSSMGGGQGLNNPGNLRASPNSFKRFDTAQTGLLAMANQLQRYEDLDKFGHADTLSKLIGIYAPAKDHNDTAAYIRNVSKWTGFDPNQHLNLHDRETLAKVMSAMLKQENSKNHYSPEQLAAMLASNQKGANKAAASALNGGAAPAQNGAPGQQSAAPGTVAPKPMTTHISVTISNAPGNNAAASVNQVTV